MGLGYSTASWGGFYFLKERGKEDGLERKACCVEDERGSYQIVAKEEVWKGNWGWCFQLHTI